MRMNQARELTKLLGRVIGLSLCQTLPQQSEGIVESWWRNFRIFPATADSCQICDSGTGVSTMRRSRARPRIQ